MRDGIDLRHLRYAVVLADELHFGHAAQRLGMAQPPLSREIKRLETALGIQVFIRTKRQVEVTAAGKAFLKEAKATLDQADRAVRTAHRAGRGELGVLEIAFVPAASFNIVPEAVRRFWNAFPDVQLALHEMAAPRQIQSLRYGDINVGFFFSSAYQEGIDVRPVVSEPLVVAMPRGHPLSVYSTLTPAKLEEQPFLLLPGQASASVYDQFAGPVRHAGLPPSINQTDLGIHTVLSLVAAGLGVGLVPSSVRNTRRTGITYRALREPAPRMEILMAWCSGRITPVVERFLEVATEAASDLQAVSWSDTKDVPNAV
jgi:DNA-binding transcriptional LysR family regulator